jgi:hypothetical protein
MASPACAIASRAEVSDQEFPMMANQGGLFGPGERAAARAARAIKTAAGSYCHPSVAAEPSDGQAASPAG